MGAGLGWAEGEPSGMAPDQPRRDRPLRADPLSGATGVLDRDGVIDLRDRPADAADEARLAARPSSTLPRLSRRADLLDWAQSKRRQVGRRSTGRSAAASTATPLGTGTATGTGTTDAPASGRGLPAPDPSGRNRMGTRLRGAPVRQLVEGAALVLLGLGLLLGWVVHVSWTPLVDGALVVLGVVLVIQARRATPSRPLMALGVLLALVAAATWRADVTLDGGIGRRNEAPTAARTAPYEYRLGTGQLTIDLRSAVLGGTPLRVDAEVGAGRIVVRVPEDAAVTGTAVAGGGQVVAFGERHLGPGLDEPAAGPAFTTRVIELDLRVGLGSVEVNRG